MNPQVKKVLAWAVVITAVIGSLGPDVAAFSGLVPAKWLTVASHFIGSIAAIHAFLIESPLVTPLLARKTDKPSLPSPISVATLWTMFFSIWLVYACSTTLAQWAADIQAGKSAVVPAEQLACDIASVVDPSGSTAVCADIDSAGNIISDTFLVTEDATSVANLIKNTPVALRTKVSEKFKEKKAGK
jgi:hypothetical protein